MQAQITRVDYRVDVDTLHRQQTETLDLNHIGRVEIATGQPIFFDSYRVNVATGDFILIDPDTNGTVAAGMIRGEVQNPASEVAATNLVWQDWNIPRATRETQNGHRAAVVWLTGLSGAGKTTIAREVERRLFDRGCRTMLLDGDQIRHGLCSDLGFSPAARSENIRRAGEVARLFFEQGCIVLCAFVSPYARDRERAHALVPEGRFIQVWVKATLSTCRQRDAKGLYREVSSGQIAQFTGISAPYEDPVSPDLTLDTEALSVDEGAALIVSDLESRGLLRLRPSL